MVYTPSGGPPESSWAPSASVGAAMAPATLSGVSTSSISSSSSSGTYGRPTMSSSVGSSSSMPRAAYTHTPCGARCNTEVSTRIFPLPDCERTCAMPWMPLQGMVAAKRWGCAYPAKGPAGRTSGEPAEEKAVIRLGCLEGLLPCVALHAPEASALRFGA